VNTVKNIPIWQESKNLSQHLIPYKDFYLEVKISCENPTYTKCEIRKLQEEAYRIKIYT
jgi:hypothetical protein